MIAAVVGTFVLLASSVAVLCLEDRPNLTDLGRVSEAQTETGHHADEMPVLAVRSKGESGPSLVRRRVRRASVQIKQDRGQSTLKATVARFMPPQSEAVS